jgi:hypothetical protein
MFAGALSATFFPARSRAFLIGESRGSTSSDVAVLLDQATAGAIIMNGSPRSRASAAAVILLWMTA